MKHGLLTPTSCSPSDPENVRHMFWYRYRDGQKVPGAGIIDCIPVRDGTRDQIRLRLKDGSCK